MTSLVRELTAARQPERAMPPVRAVYEIPGTHSRGRSPATTPGRYPAPADRCGQSVQVNHQWNSGAGTGLLKAQSLPWLRELIVNDYTEGLFRAPRYLAAPVRRRRSQTSLRQSP